MMWFAILAFALACTALIAVGAVTWLLIAVTQAMESRGALTPRRELTRP
ncbi:hypothetical protein [Nocardia rhizosphaerae]|uniref:Uncharacterized protein n=1 Tax=Nocardia rhizosphaerae TaxID=1691571 RepID=A0ABV8L947_9NOCA